MTTTPNYQLPTWEKSDRIMMDTFNGMTAAIDTAIKTNATGLANETKARKSADTTETNARTKADADEKSAREAADTALGTRITNEATARANADTTEKNARVKADADEVTARTNAVSAEATARANGDTAVRSAFPMVKLIDKTLTAAENHTVLDFSKINLNLYYKLEVYIYSVGGYYTMLFNNNSEKVYRVAGSTQNHIFRGGCGPGMTNAAIVTITGMGMTYLHAAVFTGLGTVDYPKMEGYSMNLNKAALKTIDLIADAGNGSPSPGAGSRIVVYGTKL